MRRVPDEEGPTRRALARRVRSRRGGNPSKSIVTTSPKPRRGVHDAVGSDFVQLWQGDLYTVFAKITSYNVSFGSEM